MAKKVIKPTADSLKRSEGQTSPAKATKSKAVEDVEAEEIIETVESEEVVDAIPVDIDLDSPKLFEGKQMYWARTMHFRNFGKIEGLIKEIYWTEFMKEAPKDIDVFTWITSVDHVAIKLAENKRKMRAKIGLID